ncbi:MAG TPA: hypothetical protein VFI96_06450, partial [Longimicrobiaceae bacterium]|nr:hypothetical protein [Longimicrobiaceae bacterium]
MAAHAKTRQEVELSSTRRLVLLWAGVLTGPAVFLIQLQVNYTLVTLACSRARPWLHLSAITALLLTLGAGAIAWRDWRYTGGGWPGDGGGTVPRSRWLSMLGMLMSALFALVLLVQWLFIVLVG